MSGDVIEVVSVANIKQFRDVLRNEVKRLEQYSEGYGLHCALALYEGYFSKELTEDK